MSGAAAFGQLVLSTAFVLSIVAKLRDFPAFRAHVSATLPALGRLAPWTAACCVASEAGITVALFAVRPPWVGPALACILITAFTGYLLHLVTSGGGASCGCAGADDIPASWVHVLRNAALFTTAAVLVLLTVPGGGGTVAAHPAALAVYAVVAAPAAAAGALLLHLPDVIALFRPPTDTRQPSKGPL
ncbi:MauE/DoxX family redox-associated membrane protein [Streptomyces sp. NPDC007369]|uniref:MauE/DoxX family redox-associated membrane protein n=1 Tax=Streptomyces sp. NPDC007369 TaxID=3154589 RepID=UPI0033CEFBC0